MMTCLNAKIAFKPISKFLIDLANILKSGKNLNDSFPHVVILGSKFNVELYA
jgi:hypothetical protein